MYVVVHGYRDVWCGSQWEVLAGGGCRLVSAAGGVSGGCRRTSGMEIIASIDREAAHDDSREFINFPVNLLYSDFLPLFNQYCLHLSNRGNFSEARRR